MTSITFSRVKHQGSSEGFEGLADSNKRFGMRFTSN